MRKRATNPHSESMARDAMLEAELKDLQEERATLSVLQLERKVEIKNRCEEIGKERMRLFLERRKLQVPQVEQPPVVAPVPIPIQEPSPIPQSWTLF
jgi:hypothetical protein